MAETVTRRKARGFREHSARASVYVILFVAGLIVLIPFLLAFFGSFKTAEDVERYMTSYRAGILAIGKGGPYPDIVSAPSISPS